MAFLGSLLWSKDSLPNTVRSQTCSPMKQKPCKSPVEPVRVGYVLKMFPRLSETFILNEILELERQGLELRVFSLKRPVEKVSHAQARQVRSPITYLPETLHHAPLRIAQGHFHAWSRHRRAWRHALRNSLRRLRADGNSNDLLA